MIRAAVAFHRKLVPASNQQHNDTQVWNIFYAKLAIWDESGGMAAGFIMQHSSSTFTVALRAINFKESLKDRKSVSRQQFGRPYYGKQTIFRKLYLSFSSRMMGNHIMSLYCRIFNFTAFITREPGCRWADKQPLRITYIGKFVYLPSVLTS